MSTRRARIKAVASLPPRRKNVVAEENKVKDAEKITRSTPSDGNKSTRPVNVTESKTREHIAHNVVEKLIKSEKSPRVTTESESLSKANALIVEHAPEEVHSVDIKTSSSSVFASLITPSLKVERNVNKIYHDPKSKKDSARDEYSVPSVPESTDDDPMDGIVPFKPAASVPEPIDVLKNEIISENAEVLFDPIIPLPSTSKVHPKLRPVLRLAPLGRNIVQGNASESEDENRRSLLSSKDRNAPDVHTLQSSPNRTQEESRRRTAMGQRRVNVKREPLTMYDLMFYNPTSNPLVLSEDEMNLKEAKEKQEKGKEGRIKKEKETVVKSPDSPKKSADSAPVPQVKLGPNEEIILDEQSLVIKQTESDRKVSSVVHEGAWGTGGPYKKLKLSRSKVWNEEETIRFYRALTAVGTDFTLMAMLFPDRTRKQLKNKFKREEKYNTGQIEDALSARQYDVELLKAEFEEERAMDAKEAETEREMLIRAKQDERKRRKTGRLSLGAKAIEICKVPRYQAYSAEDIINHHKLMQKNIKRPTQKITPTSKTSTVTLVSSASKSTDDKPNSETITPSSASKPEDDMPNSRTNKPSLPSGLRAKAIEICKVPRYQAFSAEDIINHHKLMQKNIKRPTQKITPTPKTSTVALVSSASKSTDDKPNSETITPSSASKPEDDMPNSRTNKPSLPSGLGAKAIEICKVPRYQAYSAEDIINHHKLMQENIKRPTQKITPTPKTSTVTLVSSASKSTDDKPNRDDGSVGVPNDPSSPEKKILQTYVANGPGKLTPVALPPPTLNYLVEYMKKGILKGSNVSCPLISPSSVTSVESHNSAQSDITVLLSPAKRQKRSSDTITQL